MENTIKEIDRSTLLKATALLHMVQQKFKEQCEIEAELANVLGVPDDGDSYFGHVSDSVSQGYSIKQLLSKLKYKVK